MTYRVRRSYLNNHSIKSYTIVVQIWTPHRVFSNTLFCLPIEDFRWRTLFFTTNHNQTRWTSINLKDHSQWYISLPNKLHQLPIAQATQPQHWHQKGMMDRPKTNSNTSGTTHKQHKARKWTSTSYHWSIIWYIPTLETTTIILQGKE